MNAYWDFPALDAWVRDLPARFPDRVRVESIGRSRQGRPLWLVALGRGTAAEVAERPALWVDAGTHCAEWAGVMAAVHLVESWLAGPHALSADTLSTQTVYVAPCISPDGYQAMHEGAPYLRSTLRPPRPGAPRIGLEPRDMDGDGAVRWMRWRHPAGPFVCAPDLPFFLRPRTVDDAPEDAFFVCQEGEFLCADPGQVGDAAAWIAAPREFGLDLNRNFPAGWAPFAMFGMDGGAYALSEPESRAVVDAFAARPHIAAGLTLHTYTGALLTQPYRKPSPLSDADVELMDRLARQVVADTGWRAIRVHPDFMYDPEKPIVGVWADTMATVFGVPGYTLEIWDPFGHCGVDMPQPAAFFRTPDVAVVRALVSRFSEAPHAITPWRPFDHPQLGPVEIGGLDYMRTVRNPPLAELKAECEKTFRVADRLRRALPQVEVELSATAVGPELWRVEARFENLGGLSAAGLARGETLVGTPGQSAALSAGPGVRVIEGAPEQAFGPLAGWLALQVETHPLYPGLSDTRAHRAAIRWLVAGPAGGVVELAYHAGRAGQGRRHLRLGGYSAPEAAPP